MILITNLAALKKRKRKGKNNTTRREISSQPKIVDSREVRIKLLKFPEFITVVN